MSQQNNHIHKQSLLSEQNINTQLTQTTSQTQVYSKDPYRYFNLFLFLFAALANSIPNQTFTAINTRICQLYNVNKVFVGMNTLFFPITHPILAFFANGILDKFGLRYGCALGSILMIIGVWIRVLINQSAWFTLLGSLIASCGNLFIINSPSKLANNWFLPQQVPIITTTGVLFSLLSSALSLIIPAFFVNIHSPKSDIVKMLFIEAALVSFPMILLIIFFRDKPKKPPSFAAALKSKNTYMQDLKVLFSSKNYLILILIMSMSYGTIISLLTDIQYIILPFGFESPIKLASNLLLAASLIGIIGCFVFIRILKKTMKFKVILSACLTGSLILTILFPFSLSTGFQWLALINLGLVGFFIIPVTPMIMQFGCEVAFPVGQASSSGFLLAGAQLLGFIAGTTFLSFLDGKKAWKCYLVCGVFSLFYAIGLIGIYFSKQDLRRRNFQQRSRRKSIDFVNQ